LGHHLLLESAEMGVHSAKELTVYKKSFATAMAIFEASKAFPQEERFALTGQIRRSSRSICLNLREAWAKRRYEAHFISKLTDCDGESGETDSSLDFALACGYISRDQHQELTEANEEVTRMLNGMIRAPEKFVLRR
jgi:four helix bundle protein